MCDYQVVCPHPGATESVLLSFKKKTRTWQSYAWPPAHEVEHPQILECDERLWIVARGVTEKATLTVWTFVYHQYSPPDCRQVTRMPEHLYRKVFPYGYRMSHRSEFDCTSSPCTLAFTCRDRPTIIACYNVKRNVWYDLPLYYGYVEKLTFLANWRFQPAAHAQV